VLGVFFGDKKNLFEFVGLLSLLSLNNLSYQQKQIETDVIISSSIDKVESVKWYKLAAEQGDAQAQ
jgi:hypothetical protein